MMYRIDVRKDGDIIDQFEVSPDFIVELMLWRQNGGGKGTAPSAVKSEKTKGGDKVGGKKVRTCSACGQPGHRSDTCPGVGAQKEESEENTLTAGAMSKDQWEEAKAAQNNGVSADDVAEQIGVEVREVNKAFISRKYGAYLLLRKKD